MKTAQQLINDIYAIMNKKLTDSEIVDQILEKLIETEKKLLHL